MEKQFRHAEFTEQQRLLDVFRNALCEQRRVALTSLRDFRNCIIRL